MRLVTQKAMGVHNARKVLGRVKITLEVKLITFCYAFRLQL